MRREWIRHFRLLFILRLARRSVGGEGLKEKYNQLSNERLEKIKQLRAALDKGKEKLESMEKADMSDQVGFLGD